MARSAFGGCVTTQRCSELSTATTRASHWQLRKSQASPRAAISLLDQAEPYGQSSTSPGERPRPLVTSVWPRIGLRDGTVQGERWPKSAGQHLAAVYPDG